ncbi:MAG: hypothetical protein NVS9B10_06790 [Nevskia sp.]
MAFQQEGAVTKNELLRQRAVDELGYSPEWPNRLLGCIADLAAMVAGMPYAALSILDEDRQFYAAATGFRSAVIPRAQSFCQQTILGDGALVVADASTDDRFARSPLVVGPEAVRFYAGVPVRAPSGFKIGALCVMDRVPRQLDAGQIASLAKLAALAEVDILLRTLDIRDRDTGLYTTASFTLVCDQIWRRARSAGLPVVVICLEVGGLAGRPRAPSERAALLDEAIGLIKTRCAGHDALLSHGPANRFTILLVNEDLATGRQLAEWLRDHLQELTRKAVPETEAAVAVQVGFAQSARHAHAELSFTSLLTRAYESMRESRTSGSSRDPRRRRGLRFGSRH